MDKYLCWILMVLSVVIASFSQVLLKKSAVKTYRSVIFEYINPLVLVGYVLMLLTTLLTVSAYKTGLAYKNGPVIESLGYIIIMFNSLVFFGEKITLRKLLGNSLIILGIVVFYI